METQKNISQELNVVVDQPEPATKPVSKTRSSLRFIKGFLFGLFLPYLYFIASAEKRDDMLLKGLSHGAFVGYLIYQTLIIIFMQRAFEKENDFFRKTLQEMLK